MNKVLFDPHQPNEEKYDRVIACEKFGPNKQKINSFIYMKGQEQEGEEEYWFAEIKTLFKVRNKLKNIDKEYAYVRFIITTTPLHEIDKKLGCVCLRWETEDGIDHTLEKNCTMENEVISSGENYGLVQFQSICGTMQLIRSNYGIQPFTDELPWTHHRFYVNRFIS